MLKNSAVLQPEMGGNILMLSLPLLLSHGKFQESEQEIRSPQKKHYIIDSGTRTTYLHYKE